MSITRVPIRNGDDQYPRHPVSGAVGAVDEHWARFQGNRPVPVGVTVGHTVPAKVVHGRWVVVCPDESCFHALEASKRDRRFLCVVCGNKRSGGLWLTVTWPDDVEAGEALLGMRPNVKNQNWLPGESVADLAAENLTQGVL